nr:SOS response-associated peptidase family protein [Legionella israelensis]
MAIYQIEPDYLKASYFYWGLIPFWAKDKKIGSQMINAKAETLSQKPTLKKLLNNVVVLFPCLFFLNGKGSEIKKRFILNIE